MSNAEAARMARCLKTLSDPNRIQILRILVQGEFCVSDLVAQLQVDQPKVSHHLAILRSAGIIRCRRDGRHINYSLLPSVHRRLGGAPGGDGPVDAFDLGALSVSFCFQAAADGMAAAPSEAGSLRIHAGDGQLAARPPAAGMPASATGGSARA